MAPITRRAGHTVIEAARPGLISQSVFRAGGRVLGALLTVGSGRTGPCTDGVGYARGVDGVGIGWGGVWGVFLRAGQAEVAGRTIT